MTMLYIAIGAICYVVLGHLYARLTLRHYLSTRRYDIMGFLYDERDLNVLGWIYLLLWGPLIWPVMLVWWVLAVGVQKLLASMGKAVSRANPFTIEKRRREHRLAVERAALEAERKAAAEAAQLLEDEYLTGIRIRPDADVDLKLTKPRGGGVRCRTCKTLFEGEFALEEARLHYRTTHDGWVLR